jgi:hypothetical protein
MSFGISIGDVLKVCELAGRVYKSCTSFAASAMLG